MLSAFLKFTVPVVLLATGMEQPAHATAKKTFQVAWSLYVGWVPWEYADRSGILKKWADKYGIEIKLTRVSDYIESITQYTAGGFDACAMTNMDLLTIPAASGVDSTALIVGDFSNGNDGVVLKGKDKRLADIKGQSVKLVELSVSHYLLARGLASARLGERDIKVVNVSDADILREFAAPDTTAVVTWKPQLTAVMKMQDVTQVFDSSKIPGEIIDLMVVKSATLQANPELGKALVGAWYETLALMSGTDAKAAAALASMAKASGGDVASFKSQLATTKMFAKPADAVAFTKSPDLLKAMDLIRTFSFNHGLLSKGAKSADAVGMAFPGGRTLGNPKNVKMRFEEHYMELASERKL
jgi:NitT/TauT family transport system substrate-binding protein